MPVPLFPLQIFYDGSCAICAREIEQYLRQDREGKLVPIDISAPGFDPGKWGIPLDELMYELHTIDRVGTIYHGIESFRAIWQAFPSSSMYGFLGNFTAIPVINGIAKLCYRGFASIRRFLPKRRYECETGSCQLGRKKSPEKTTGRPSEKGD